MPHLMPARAGSAYSQGPAFSGALPARSLYDAGYKGLHFGPSGEDCPPADPQVLEQAREAAKKEEEEGRAAAKRGPVAMGPPGLPTGVVVVEQKFVDFLLGPAGQSLAAINHAAGVTVILDQANKFSGYSLAKIYGPEAKANHGKLAIDFKVSQWLPRSDRSKAGGDVDLWKQRTENAKRRADEFQASQLAASHPSTGRPSAAGQEKPVMGGML